MTHLLDGVNFSLHYCKLQSELDQMGPSALGNQHRSKLTVQTEITSKSVALVAFESSSLTAELKFESHWVGRVDEFVVTVRMVEIERLMGEIAGPVRHLVKAWFDPPTVSRAV